MSGSKGNQFIFAQREIHFRSELTSLTKVKQKPQLLFIIKLMEIETPNQQFQNK